MAFGNEVAQRVELPHIWEEDHHRQYHREPRHTRPALILRPPSAADDHVIQLAAESEARYGRRFRMRDLDRAMESVRSGLLRVPTIVMSV